MGLINNVGIAKLKIYIKNIYSLQLVKLYL